MWTMQSQPRNISGNCGRSRMGSLDEHRSLFQSPWCPDIENDRRITPVEQPGDEGLAEIPRSSGQKHLHRLLRHLPPVAKQYRCTQERSVGIE